MEKGRSIRYWDLAKYNIVTHKNIVYEYTRYGNSTVGEFYIVHCDLKALEIQQQCKITPHELRYTTGAAETTTICKKPLGVQVPLNPGFALLKKNITLQK